MAPFRGDRNRPYAEPVAVYSERAAGKPKKREGLWKPKSEPTPNRISERLLPESKGLFVVQRSMTRDDVLY
jgi:hypothetical protein